MPGETLTEIDLGYCFEPRQRPASPGHPRLAITLPETPTLRHFDPEAVCLAVVEDDEVFHETVHHAWPGSEHLTLCAGLIHIRDRKGKCVAAFTYGGEARIIVEEAHTHLVVSSPAPILDLTVPDPFTVPALLAAETEVLIAGARADWDRAHRHEDFDDQLGQVDPAALYAACIATLVARFETIPCCDSHDAAFVRFLHAERAYLYPDAPVMAFGAEAFDFVLAHGG